jgi:hypothetical protein
MMLGAQAPRRKAMHSDNGQEGAGVLLRRTFKAMTRFSGYRRDTTFFWYPSDT